MKDNIILPIRKVLSTFLAATLVLALSGCQNTEAPAVSPGEPVESAAEPAPTDTPPETDLLPEDAWPEVNWEFDTPEHHGMDSETLRNMHTALQATEIYSVVTVKDGVIIDEYYKDGYDETSVFALHSVSKSFTSALIGIALDEGFIDDIDDPISKYLPQAEGTDKADITLRHLLEHTGGFEWYEWGGNATTFFDWRSHDDWVDYVLNQPMVATPGSTWNYTTGGTHLLAAVLQQATGQSTMDFATEHIFGPLGMHSVEWGEDPMGVADGGNGLSMTSRDAAKFGQLFLDGGRWGDMQLVPEPWVDMSTDVQVVRYTNSGSYGYQWWIRPFGAANYDAYYAMGAWGQFIFVVPELNLVTVLTSNHPEDTYLPWPYFSDYILGAYIEE